MRSARVSISTARRVDMAERTRGVDADARLLHAQKDGDEREVHGAVEVEERGVVGSRSLRCARDAGYGMTTSGVDDEAANAASLSAICSAKTRARRTMAAAASGRRLGSAGLALVG